MEVDLLVLAGKILEAKTNWQLGPAREKCANGEGRELPQLRQQIDDELRIVALIALIALIRGIDNDGNDHGLLGGTQGQHNELVRLLFQRLVLDAWVCFGG